MKDHERQSKLADRGFEVSRRQVFEQWSSDSNGSADDVDLVVLTDKPETFDPIPTVKLKGPRPYADHVKVPRILKRLRPDIYHNTKNCLPRTTPCPSVVT
ncbi:MAG: hypothetical protein IH936_15235, partial [Acidobacteria bacterium]|nr:hypothetical protein [Acidobacteriota bacterium]